MANALVISIHFLSDVCHARDEAGDPEWPPSPVRLFQALVAGAAAWFNERSQISTAAKALAWLERSSPPLLVAENAISAKTSYRMYVPDNVGDKVASSWSRGNLEATIADYRTEKDVRPMWLQKPLAALRYIWKSGIDDASVDQFLPILQPAARSVTHLGWGIDMVVGDAEILTQEQVNALPGQRWHPTDGLAANMLRVPVAGTLEALQRRHQAFLNRLAPDSRGNNSFRPVPPLTTFRNVGYRRESDPTPTRYVAFKLIACDGGRQPAFDTAKRTRDVAGMLRHAVAAAAERQKWDAKKTNNLIHGKVDSGDSRIQKSETSERLSYLPLPTINPALNRVEAIRRVMIAAPASAGAAIDWASRVMPGNTLVAEGQGEVAFLEPLPNSDWVYKQYVGHAYEWATVTPVILPRHPKKRDGGIGGMIRLAFEQAGFDRALIQNTEFEVRGAGFLPGNLLASKYIPPKNLSDRPRFHVRACFPHEMRGPIAIGAGRFRGFGLFVHFRSRVGPP